VAVNNAGTINKNNKTWSVPAEEFDTVVDTNIKGTANVLRHFIPLMIEKKHGIIVNLSSGWGRSAAAEVGHCELCQCWFLSLYVKNFMDTELHIGVSGCPILCFKVGN
jgi:NAD(P)-dependent dehydrogenase (short-subunit alcohol dehydrogenase family)